MIHKNAYLCSEELRLQILFSYFKKKNLIHYSLATFNFFNEAKNQFIPNPNSSPVPLPINEKKIQHTNPQLKSYVAPSAGINTRYGKSFS